MTRSSVGGARAAFEVRDGRDGGGRWVAAVAGWVMVMHDSEASNVAPERCSSHEQYNGYCELRLQTVMKAAAGRPSSAVRQVPRQRSKTQLWLGLAAKSYYFVRGSLARRPQAGVCGVGLGWCPRRGWRRGARGGQRELELVGADGDGLLSADEAGRGSTQGEVLVRRNQGNRKREG